MYCKTINMVVKVGTFLTLEAREGAYTKSRTGTRNRRVAGYPAEVPDKYQTYHLEEFKKPDSPITSGFWFVLLPLVWASAYPTWTLSFTWECQEVLCAIGKKLAGVHVMDVEVQPFSMLFVQPSHITRNMTQKCWSFVQSLNNKVSVFV